MFKFSDEQLALLLQGIFEGTITEYDLPENLYFALADYLKTGLYEGFGGVLSDFKIGTADFALLSEMRESLYMFSGAKTFQQVRDMTDALIDDDGVVRSFSSFKETAQAIFDQYNVNWLDAEYDTAIGQGMMGAKWNDIQANKDVLPFLEYDAVDDESLCDICGPLNGMTAAVDDPVWDEYYPEMHFRCRCTVRQLDEDEAKPTSQEDIDDITGRVREKVEPEFLMNAGKDKVVFSDEHPYFQNVPKEAAKDNFGLPIPENDDE